MKLDVLSLKDCQKARIWRNNVIETLRTSHFLTEEMQNNFYNNVVCDRNSKNRFFALRNDTSEWSFIGMVGIVNIEWENRIGEISLIIDPSERGKGHGMKAIDLLLNKGFESLNLNTIYGECYNCNPSINFWEKVIKKYDAYKTILINRKYYNNIYYNSLYFSIDSIKYNKQKNVNEVQ
jgi:RimJ/RimL family protein N-acetyltransferase